jgi:Circularly permutated YpsA SLOG family
MVKRIVSGGQTGADRAAWDVALELGLEIGGWVPKGRLAEDGSIPERYTGRREAALADPAVRTVLNVRDLPRSSSRTARSLAAPSSLSRKRSDVVGPCFIWT